MIMKIKRNRFTTTNVILLSLVMVTLLGLGVFAYKKWTASGPSSSDSGNNKVNYNPPTDEQTQAGNDIKNSTVNSQIGKPPAPGTDGNTQPPTGNTIPVTITAANQSGEKLSVRSLIEAIISNGTCTLTLTKDATVVTKTSEIQPLANSSTCKGFDIPTSELSSGEWRIQLDIASGNMTGTASRTVTVE